MPPFLSLNQSRKPFFSTAGCSLRFEELFTSVAILLNISDAFLACDSSVFLE
jgi:hypothetical protein